MKKCSNCGTEYEGNCCPNCGTWSEEERICPRCGDKMKVGANFCSYCGFTFGGSPDNKPQKNGGSSFKEKMAKVGKWMKKHLFIVIPVAVVLVVAIILACSIPACIKAKDNGTYYKLESNGEIDKKTYFIIDSGEWKDEDGESGTYKKDGDKIIFYIEFFGSKEEIESGTIKDGVLKVGDDEYPDIYISSSHKHKYGDWKMTKAPCTEDGEEERLCACGVKETRVVEKRGHSVSDEWQFDETNHYKVCKDCNQKVDIAKHTAENYCSVCNYGTVDIDGLKFGLNNDKSGYSVIGVSNKAIKSIKIPAKVKSLPVTNINGSAFSGCSSLTSINIPDSVTSIDSDAFYNCTSLTSITIPDGVTSIYGGVFRDCTSLTSVIIPDSVKNIDSKAFNGCLKLIQRENGVQYVDKWAIGCDTFVTELTLRSDTKGIAVSAFINRSNITSVTIPDGVTSIGESAFYGCSSLTDIAIPNRVQRINNFAFADCGKLTSITIPDGVTSIGNGAFSGCSSLTSITIPDSVTSIEYDAFKGCSSLTDINFNGTKAQWNAIEKSNNWNSYTNKYTIHCTDGDIKK